MLLLLSANIAESFRPRQCPSLDTSAKLIFFSHLDFLMENRVEEVTFLIKKLASE